jgi:hypothetical protein
MYQLLIIWEAKSIFSASSINLPSLKQVSRQILREVLLELSSKAGAFFASRVQELVIFSGRPVGRFGNGERITSERITSEIRGCRRSASERKQLRPRRKQYMFRFFCE